VAGAALLGPLDQAGQLAPEYAKEHDDQHHRAGGDRQHQARTVLRRGIAVTFHTVMSVIGGNSIANVVSVTPGGVGVNQAANVAALGDVTDAATATAYSLGQQLAVTAWNSAFAVALVVWASGWVGGKELVEHSYADAKVKVAEQKEQRTAGRAAKRSIGDRRRSGLRRRP
jgi:hypothetical protein